MKTKLAMFDLDGTLYDTRKTNYCAYRDALKHYSINLDYNYFSKYCNGKHYAQFLPQIMGSSDCIDEVHNMKKVKYIEYLKESVENRHLFDIIKGLKDEYYIALVTTASRKNCIEILDHHNRLDEFDLIISQEDVKKKKPDPEGFFKAMNHFNIQSDDSIIFEDSDVGVKAATNSGAAVFIVRGYA